MAVKTELEVQTIEPFLGSLCTAPLYTASSKCMELLNLQVTISRNRIPYNIFGLLLVNF